MVHLASTVRGADELFPKTSLRGALNVPAAKKSFRKMHSPPMCNPANPLKNVLCLTKQCIVELAGEFLARNQTCTEPKCEPSTSESVCGGYVKELPYPQMPTNMGAVDTYCWSGCAVCGMRWSTRGGDIITKPMLKSGSVVGRRTLCLTSRLKCIAPHCKTCSIRSMHRSIQ